MPVRAPRHLAALLIRSRPAIPAGSRGDGARTPANRHARPHPRRPGYSRITRVTKRMRGSHEDGQRTRAETPHPRRRGARAARCARGRHVPRLASLLRKLLRPVAARAAGAAARAAPVGTGRGMRCGRRRGRESRGPAPAPRLRRCLGAIRRYRRLGLRPATPS